MIHRGEIPPDDIDTKKLTRELGAKPRDFSRIKKLIQAVKKSDGKESSKLNDTIFLFPLFCSQLDSATVAIFCSIILIGYKKKIEFLKKVTNKNIHSLLQEKRDIWIQYFCTILRMDDLFPEEHRLTIQLLRKELEKEEKRFGDILKEKWSEVGVTYNDLWSEEGLPAEAIFVNKDIASRKPEISIPYIDEFLCYHEAILFTDLLTDGIFKGSQKSFSLWIMARSDLLADTSTETYKIFCRIFHLGKSGIFDTEGNLCLQAIIQIPDEFHDSLILLEQKRKLLLEKQKSHKDVAEVQNGVQQRMVQILSQKLHLSYNEDSLLGLESIPQEIEDIEITISRGGKAYARTTLRLPCDEPVDLKTCLFETFHPHKKGQEWEVIAEWKGGDTYSIHAVGKIKHQKTPDQVVYSWSQPRIMPPASTDPPAIGEIIGIVRDRAQKGTDMTTLRHPPSPNERGEVSKVVITQPRRDPKEDEKENLLSAIEILLGEQSGHLQEICVENTVWDKHTQTITVTLPEEVLVDIGYERDLLSLLEYQVIAQWEAHLENGKWMYTPHTPAEIQKIIPQMYTTLQKNQKRESIDNELSKIGLPPSERENNDILRASLGGKKINYALLKERIQEIKSLFPVDELGKTQYKFFHGKEEKGIIPNLTLSKNGLGTATLTLSPEIRFHFTDSSKSTKNKHSDYELRIESALLNFIYGCIRERKRGLAGIIESTYILEDIKKLRESYKKDLREKKARLLVQNSDETFTIIEGIGKKDLLQKIQELQKKYGRDNVAILLRRNTYAFVGERSICRPSPRQSDDDYTSLDLPERQDILKERILKTLFNGKSGVQDRATFINGSGVYQTLMLQRAKFKEDTGRELERGDIDEDFVKNFIKYLKKNAILISYRDFRADSVSDLTDFSLGEGSPE